jgi:hypothetical protein
MFHILVGKQDRDISLSRSMNVARYQADATMNKDAQSDLAHGATYIARAGHVGMRICRAAW